MKAQLYSPFKSRDLLTCSQTIITYIFVFCLKSLCQSESKMFQ